MDVNQLFIREEENVKAQSTRKPKRWGFARVLFIYYCFLFGVCVCVGGVGEGKGWRREQEEVIGINAD